MSRFKRGAFRGGAGRRGRQRHTEGGFITAGTVRFTQQIEVDSGKALALMSSLGIGFVKRRTDKGRDISGAPFKQYSATYSEALTKAGENPGKVDLTLTGGLVNSINEISRAVTQHGGVVRIGPGTGTSPQVSLWGGHAKRTGKRGPAHNIVGSYLHFGTPKMPARKFLGLTLKERKKISRALKQQSAKVLKEKRSGGKR
jgi:phage gpG-like protein